jgi:hypothetical protein
VVECFDRLRHDAVVSCDHKNCDVGHLSTTRTHGSERLVTWGVNEGDETVNALVHGVHLVRTDVLSDATGFSVDDAGLANRVEQTGLSVVNVTHDRDHWGSFHEVFIGFIFELLFEVDIEGLEEFFVFVLGAHNLNLESKLLAQNLERRVIKRLGGRGHLAQVEQNSHEVGRASANLLGEVGERGTTTHRDDCRTVTARNTHATE